MMRRKREMAAEFPVCTVVGRHGLIFWGESNFRKAREKVKVTLAPSLALGALGVRFVASCTQAASLV